jgi:hypothetical protein
VPSSSSGSDAQRVFAVKTGLGKRYLPEKWIAVLTKCHSKIIPAIKRMPSLPWIRSTLDQEKSGDWRRVLFVVGNCTAALSGVEIAVVD